LVHLAEGEDADGNKFHLVRDISLGYGPKIQSQFIYSQKQILEEIIPNKVKEMLELLTPPTTSSCCLMIKSLPTILTSSLRRARLSMRGQRSMYFPFGVQPDYFPGQGSSIGTSIAAAVNDLVVRNFFAYQEAKAKLLPEITNNNRNHINKDAGTASEMTTAILVRSHSTLASILPAV